MLGSPARERDQIMPKLSKAQEMRIDIKNKIDRGIYVPGQKLPSGRELCVSYQVSMIVVREAINWLKATGYVESLPGSGYYVTSRPPSVGKDS